MKKQKTQVVITRIFPASVERMWKAFTDPSDMLRWHSPVGMTTPHAEVDLRLNGTYVISMKYDTSGEIVTVRGKYMQIQKPNKLVYTWKWDGSDMETFVTVEFRKITESKTEVVLTHSGFDEIPTKTDLENNWTSESHTAGWTTGFDKLDQLVKDA